MFKDCKWTFDGLKLSATTLKYAAYAHMFENCINLTEAPELPAKILTDNCYLNMFSGCTNLTNIPELPAETLTKYCYSYMFSGCTGLTDISYTIFNDNVNLSTECYYGMFENCTNITSARILKKVLPDSADKCFGRLFAGCSKLSNIVYYCNKLGEDTNTGINHTYLWVLNVSPTGNWYNANLQNFTNMSDSEIPNGWVIKEWDADKSVDPNTINDYFTFTNNNTSTSVINLSVNVDLLYYSYDDIKWETYNKNENLGIFDITLAQNSKVRLKAVNTLENTTTFDINNNLNGINISGNIQTLSAGDDYKNLQNKATYCYCLFKDKGRFTIDGLILGSMNLTANCYEYMFSGTGLKSIPEGLLPATTLADSCYARMFFRCLGLSSVPKGLLPATTLAPSCYAGMFLGCRALMAFPDLPATNLAEYCYSSMFDECTNLMLGPALPATTLANGCYANMFSNSGLTSAPSLPATTLADGCYSSMFANISYLENAPSLPATTLANGCYNNMFNGCKNLISVYFHGREMGSYCTKSFLKGVPTTGKFYYYYEYLHILRGDDGIPDNWTAIKQ